MGKASHKTDALGRWPLFACRIDARASNLGWSNQQSETRSYRYRLSHI